MDIITFETECFVADQLSKSIYILKEKNVKKYILNIEYSRGGNQQYKSSS